VGPNLERWIVQRDAAGDLSRRGTEAFTGVVAAENGTAWEGRRTHLANGQAGLALFVDDRFLPRGRSFAVDLKVTFLDAGAGSFRVEYPAAQGPVLSDAVAYTGDGTWKTATFRLDAALWSGALAGGADLRLVAAGSDLEARFVRLLKRAPDTVLFADGFENGTTSFWNRGWRPDRRAESYGTVRVQPSVSPPSKRRRRGPRRSADPDAPGRVGAGGADVGPRDHESTQRVRGHGGLELVFGRVGVDLDLVSERHAARVVAPRLDAREVVVRSARAVARPDDHETAPRVGADPRSQLVACRVGVDLKLASQAGSCGAEALRLDAVAAQVRAARSLALPDDNEVARCAGSHGGPVLESCGVGVDSNWSPRESRRCLCAGLGC